jgi:hypothetical protein
MRTRSTWLGVGSQPIGRRDPILRRAEVVGAISLGLLPAEVSA